MVKWGVPRGWGLARPKLEFVKKLNFALKQIQREIKGMQDGM